MTRLKMRIVLILTFSECHCHLASHILRNAVHFLLIPFLQRKNAPAHQASGCWGTSAVLGIVDHLRRRSATADSSFGEFARFKSASRTDSSRGELVAHLLDLRCLLFRRAITVFIPFSSCGIVVSLSSTCFTAT